MRVIRLYVNQNLALHHEVTLDDAALHYATNVLRLNENSSLFLFNGDGFDYSCEILSIKKKTIELKVIEKIQVNNESSLVTNLLLGISKSAHMDYAIQKSVEAGVSNIYPICMQHTVYKPSTKSNRNKYQHWKKVIISACEQCGRAKLPSLLDIAELTSMNKLLDQNLGLVLDRNASKSITSIDNPVPSVIWLLIGPEGGLTNKEISLAIEKGFQPVRCGPRVLRTETAAHTALICAQLLWGDYQ